MFLKFGVIRKTSRCYIKDCLVIDEMGTLNVYETALKMVKWLKSLRSLKDRLKQLV
ncbi:MAG: hypothetical protein ACRC51_03390 [Cetobacterium sp.]